MKSLFWILIGIIAVVGYSIYQSQDIHRKYKKEINTGFKQNKKPQTKIITEQDIVHLPQPLQKYLRYVGV